MRPGSREGRFRLSRREFLGLLCAGGPGVVLAWAGVGRGRGGRDAASPGWIRHLEGMSGSTRKIGELYLRRADPLPSEAELAGQVERRVPGLGTSPVTSGRFRRVVRAAIGRDFAEGEAVRVEGWLLSATEARLAALARLRRGRSSG